MLQGYLKMGPIIDFELRQSEKTINLYCKVNFVSGVAAV